MLRASVSIYHQRLLSFLLLDMRKILKSRQLITLITLLLLAALVAIAVFIFRSRDYYKHDKTAYKQPPLFLGSIERDLKPLSLSFYRDQLYVSYLNSNRIDVFSSKGERLNSVALPQWIRPRAIAVGKGKIFVADKTGEIKIFSTKGEFINFYTFLPEKQAKIRATSVSFNKDQLYVPDSNLPGVLVISDVTFYGPVEKGEPVLLSQEGELILTIPEKRFRPSWVTPEWDLKDPTYALVSPDGRVLVSDQALGMVKVYTSTGMYAYPFEKGKKGDKKNQLAHPVAIAYDNLANPEYLKEKQSVDPSGIRGHGRVHVVDKAKNKVFAYTTTGNFLFTYGQGTLSSPTSIAIDTKHRLIFVADAGHNRITIWGY